MTADHGPLQYRSQLRALEAFQRCRRRNAIRYQELRRDSMRHLRSSLSQVFTTSKQKGVRYPVISAYEQAAGMNTAISNG
ncbi:MAG: hypothetical protein CME72_05860 [Halomonadaceae bacterium]|nr:hypothetical protein [Halomonadaceae bacterium]